jgi:hypothetical protein
MEQDDLDDRIAEQTKATPIEYARARGFAPQKVYRALRLGKLDKETCICGRTVVDIIVADIYFNVKEKTDDNEEA